MAIFDAARFWPLLVFLIPSIICSIFALYHFLFDRRLRWTLHNHSVIVILLFCLIFELTDIFWLVYNYGTGYPLSSTMKFCLIWQFIDYTGFFGISSLVGWTSIERHILIFHDQWLRRKRKRFFIHYLPLIVLLIYPISFYIFIFFIYPCKNTFQYSSIQCGYNFCPFHQRTISMWDSIVNTILPTLIIVVFNIALLIRVLYQKHRLNRRIHWRNYRIMTIQILSMSSIYFCLYLAPMTLYAAYSFGLLPRKIAHDYYATSTYLYYFVPISIPFISTFSLPELRAKFKINFQRRQQPIQHIPNPQILPNTKRIIHRSAAITPVNH